MNDLWYANSNGNNSRLPLLGDAVLSRTPFIDVARFLAVLATACWGCLTSLAGMPLNFPTGQRQLFLDVTGRETEQSGLSSIFLDIRR